jgi:hypothetical protein
MNRILLSFLAASAVILLFLHSSFADDDTKPVAVASYLNTAEIRETVGARARAILHEHKINCDVAASRSATISVPVNRAEEALQLLAKAIKAEKLQLNLLTLKGGRFFTITPDSVLEPKKAQ